MKTECSPVRDFFLDPDVAGIAKRMLGMRIVANSPAGTCSGIITETEAYAGETDRASHAYGGRFTQRTEVMYREGGIAYIYLCYGMHALLNVVTGRAGLPHAVLVRGIYPLSGYPVMEQRVKHRINVYRDGSGPGKLTRLLGITCSLNGADLIESEQLRLENTDIAFDAGQITTGPRIGIDYAGEDALLPYRFMVDIHQAEREIKKAGLI